QFASATSIGNCRIIRTKEDINTSKVRLRITKSPVGVALSDFGLFREAQITASSNLKPTVTSGMNAARHLNAGAGSNIALQPLKNPANQLAGYHPYRAPNDSSSLKIWFTKPASSLLESCPVGNGRLGAMMFGGINQERIVLNELTMWSG